MLLIRTPAHNQATMELLILFAVSFSCALGDTFLDDGVDTPSGRILGLNSEFFGVPTKTYLGIPYARAPLRFGRPEPYAPQDNVLVADTIPPACMQYSDYNFPWYDSRGDKSEDCLYLNIWSPRSSPSSPKLPVIFWIHGGGFTLGSNRIRSQTGLGLATKAPAIVVAPNYRLGAFGFLSSGSDDAPGNVGLYDLLEALQWTRTNIESFGGDLGRLTIMGEDSGATAVTLFLLSPLTQGLYTRAIVQSLVALPRDPNKHNEELGQRLADALGCTRGNSTLKSDPKTTVDCLRDAKPQRIAQVLASLDPSSTTSFVPQFGDDLLPQDPAGDLKSGRFNPVPLLIGTNKDEGSYLLTTRYPEEFGVFGHRDPIIGMDRGSAILRDTFRNLSDPEAVVRQYLDRVDPDNSKEVRRQVYAAMGDYAITCPSVYFAEQYSGRNATVQYYVFSQIPKVSVWAHWMGSTHWDEVPFVMGRPLAGLDYDSFLEYYGPELGLSDAMLRIWGSFAKDGSGFENWKNYSRTHHEYILLKYNVKRKMRGPGPHLDNCEFFRPYYGQ